MDDKKAPNFHVHGDNPEDISEDQIIKMALMAMHGLLCRWMGYGPGFLKILDEVMEKADRSKDTEGDAYRTDLEDLVAATARSVEAIKFGDKNGPFKEVKH